ncbi:MAG TPA: glycosyltransferase family 2 protein [Pyrinomonadaceae bacterium]|nr:glycosyltransferase family 2 protein [Pyrinomonadaceae bacterium]
MKISAVIITFNEEKHIADAIRSVGWADEILVVDSESTDGTREIAASLGAVVIINRWPGFSAQKQLAVDRAANEWIFSLDADERVTDELRGEIESLRSGAAAADGYRIPRLSYYMGKAIRHSGWYPDHQLRLFDRRRGRWNGAVIHESVTMDPDAKVARLSGEILHYTAEDAAHHQRMVLERYAPLGAQKMLDEGRHTSPVNAAFAAWFSFIRAYFLKLGFLDGFAGFCIAYFAAHNTFLKHLMVIEAQRTPGDEE